MASVSNLFQQFGTEWNPDADVVNAPDTSFIRADNLVPDRQGALAVRRGSTKLYSALGTGGIHSLHTVHLADDVTYRAKGIGDQLFINGVAKGQFLGSGDIAMGDDAYQMFFARGKTKKKWDGTNWNNWGVKKPSGVVTLAAVSSATDTVAAFNNSESPATSIVEGAGAIGGEADAAGAANQATKLTPDGTLFRGTIQRLFTTDQDFYEVAGIEGTPTDLIDLYVKMENPANVETIKLIFGLDNSSTDPFTTDRFEFTFDVRAKQKIPVKDFESDGYSAYEESVLSSLDQVRPQDVTGIRSPSQVKDVLAQVGSVPSPTSSAHSDANVWSHLTVTRGQFTRVGSTSARGWDTVRGFKIVYTTKKGTTPAITFADAIIVGGGKQTLTGTYRCVIRAVRAFSQYYELSPPSNQSEPLNLNHQTMQITIPGTLLSTLDPQADQIWVYLFGGWLDTYYRFAIVSATVRSGMTIDELTTPEGSDFASADERARITSWGHTLLQGADSSDIVLTLDTSELDALTINEKLEPYQMEPPDNIVGIAGTWKDRMFVLTEDGYVYPSTKRSPSGFNSAQVVDLTRYGDPHWIVRTGNGIYVGMSQDVVFLAGSGEDSEDMARIDLVGQPLNIGNPPVDSSHWVDGNSIIFRSADGLMMLTGGNLQPVDVGNVSLLWRGIDRHGIQGINIATGRFRMTVDDLMLYVLAPEGTATSSNVIYRYSFTHKQWSRLVYAQVGAFHSIFKDPDGSLIAGDAAGNLWQLDTGSFDNNVKIPVYLLSPILSGGNPLARKDAFDFQIHGTTGGDTGTIKLFKDGTFGTQVTPATYSFTLLYDDVYRINASDFGTFLKVQIEVSGSFDRLTIQHINLAYRVRPQHSVYLDTGYILPDDPGDVTWLYEIEFDANAAANVDCLIYVDEVLKQTTTIPVTVNKRRPYLIPVLRGVKGTRPRLVFKSTSANAQGSGGFDCYGVRVRMGTSGNQEGSEYRKVYPVTTAP